jgi:hypothetical protein
MADDGQIVAMLQSVGFPEYGPAFTAAGWTMSALKVSLQPRAPRPSSLSSQDGCAPRRVTRPRRPRDAGHPAGSAEAATGQRGAPEQGRAQDQDQEGHPDLDAAGGRIGAHAHQIVPGAGARANGRGLGRARARARGARARACARAVRCTAHVPTASVDGLRSGAGDGLRPAAGNYHRRRRRRSVRRTGGPQRGARRRWRPRRYAACSFTADVGVDGWWWRRWHGARARADTAAAAAATRHVHPVWRACGLHRSADREEPRVLRKALRKRGEARCAPGRRWRRRWDACPAASRHATGRCGANAIVPAAPPPRRGRGWWPWRWQRWR